MKVYKFPLDYNASMSQQIAAGPLRPIKRLIAFDLQEGVPTVWAEVDDFSHSPYLSEVVAKTENPIYVQIFGTGQYIPDSWNYVGTLQNGPYVWHLYTNLSTPNQ